MAMSAANYFFTVALLVGPGRQGSMLAFLGFLDISKPEDDLIGSEDRTRPHLHFIWIINACQIRSSKFQILARPETTSKTVFKLFKLQGIARGLPGHSGLI